MSKASALLAASAAALVLTAAGCGGSGDSNSGSSGSSGSPANSALEQAVRFTQCMRENGVPDFPDPDKDGRFVIAAGGPDQSSPAFRRARQACTSLEPPGFHQADSAERARDQQEWLKFARCMRENGIQDFPDPQDGRLKVPRDRINVNSPQFKRALNACRDVAHVGGGTENGSG
jgi:hypothetical protein